jgi:hypothetical protein
LPLPTFQPPLFQTRTQKLTNLHGCTPLVQHPQNHTFSMSGLIKAHFSCSLFI